MEKTFFIETWGCQMNDLDTQRLSGQLKLRGYRRVEDESEASLVVLNTCSIRDKSEQKVYSRLGALRPLKQQGVRIGVAGCVAQQEGESLIARMPFVDFVIGTGNIGSIDDILDGNRRVAIDFPEDRRYDYLTIDRPSPVRAQITIIEGCNKNCTYCIVPTTRGREISRPASEILAEVRGAVASGRIEVELLGQTVNAYRCPVSGTTFARLLEQVAQVDGLKRLRFITSHPSEVSDEMIAVMRQNANICRFLHLPVQSGSNAVLRRMKRLYTRERYLEVIGRIRGAIPEMLFSTDVIVGFPGETEEDFQATMALIEEVRFGGIFAFKYSPRPGTPALRLHNEVSDEVASARLSHLFAVQERIESEILASFVGKVVPVLYEGPSRHDPAVLSGKTDEKYTVNFVTSRQLEVGTILPVQIGQAAHHSLRGEALV